MMLSWLSHQPLSSGWTLTQGRLRFSLRRTTGQQTYSSKLLRTHTVRHKGVKKCNFHYLSMLNLIRRAPRPPSRKILTRGSFLGTCRGNRLLAQGELGGTQSGVILPTLLPLQKMIFSRYLDQSKYLPPLSLFTLVYFFVYMKLKATILYTMNTLMLFYSMNTDCFLSRQEATWMPLKRKRT
jgi:hypothetical protein